MDPTQRVRAMLSFIRAAERGSFASAARSLGISPAAVSKNVAGLEAALGVRLMNRSTRSLELTSEGQHFFEGAREAIHALETATSAIGSQSLTPSGVVRITTPATFGHRYLMPLIPKLIQRYPMLVPDIDFDDRRKDVVRDGYDIALRGGPPRDSSLISRKICELSSILVASPDYLRNAGVPTEVRHLQHHRLIGIQFQGSQIAQWQFKHLPIPNRNDPMPGPTVLVVSDPFAAVQAAVAGIGIAQAGLHHTWEYLKSGQLKIVLHDLYVSEPRSMTMQYPHRSLLALRVRATVEFLLQEYASIEELQITTNQIRLFVA